MVYNVRPKLTFELFVVYRKSNKRRFRFHSSNIDIYFAYGNTKKSKQSKSSKSLIKNIVLVRKYLCFQEESSPLRAVDVLIMYKILDQIFNRRAN